jgi:hypothetical protein
VIVCMCVCVYMCVSESVFVVTMCLRVCFCTVRHAELSPAPTNTVCMSLGPQQRLATEAACGRLLVNADPESVENSNHSL